MCIRDRGKDGVIRKWLRAGAHGWRLDVADELSDDFLAEIKKAVLAEKPDALLLGEVWEDASNKISYGHLRRYLQGSELDSAMDYPFRDKMCIRDRPRLHQGQRPQVRPDSFGRSPVSHGLPQDAQDAH